MEPSNEIHSVKKRSRGRRGGKLPEALHHRASVTRRAHQGTGLGKEHKARRKVTSGGALLLVGSLWEQVPPTN